MAAFNSIKKFIKSLFNVPSWMGYSQLAKTTRSLIDLGKEQFIPQQARRQETFAEAMARLNLTETDLQQRAKEFTRLMYLWMLLFIAAISYAFYLAWQGEWWGFFPTVTISLATIIQAFRYHFWLFQIKKRKLGCHIGEWWNSSLGGG